MQGFGIRTFNVGYELWASANLKVLTQELF